MTIEMEITFHDLTEDAQNEYLDFVQADSINDINPEIPIAIIEIDKGTHGEGS